MMLSVFYPARVGSVIAMDSAYNMESKAILLKIIQYYITTLQVYTFPEGCTMDILMVICSLNFRSTGFTVE